MITTAVLSDDGRYRYRLERLWAERHPLVWVMLNPSTADAEANDPTIVRCMNFAQAWGYGGIVVVNLFAWRATDPKQLRSAPDPVGPDNPATLRAIVDGKFDVVCGWGKVHRSLLMARPPLELWAERAGKELRCAGRNADGSPKHPLYLPASTELGVYRAVPVA